MTKDEATPKPRHRYHLLSEYDFDLARASGFSNTQLWNHFNQERFRLLIKMIRRDALQRTWPALMRGVRVEGDTVVISVKGGNDAARELCGALIEEMGK